MISLTPRMQLIADLVPKGCDCADIGTDHGYIPIYLLEQGICPYVILTDINAGPMEKAADNLYSERISPMTYSLRLGNGLQPLFEAEAETVIIAGMGGENISEILEDDLQKTFSSKLYILQPRTRSFQLRKSLEKSGLFVVSEHLVREADRICEVLTAVTDKPEDYQQYSCEFDYELPPLLFGNNDELLREYLDQRISAIEDIIDNLEKARSTDTDINTWKDKLSYFIEKKGTL